MFCGIKQRDCIMKLLYIMKIKKTTVMIRILFILVVTFPMMSMANNVGINDTIVSVINTTETVIGDTLSHDKIDSLQSSRNGKNLQVNNIIKQNDSLQVLRTEKNNLVREVSELRYLLDKADKCLVSVAANALYVPYEAYSVKEIAIRSFETVHNVELKNKHDTQYLLLKRYSDDVKSFLSFITRTKNEIEKNRFAHDANDALQALQTESFYISYHRYDDWESTFLGKMIDDVEKQLKLFDRKTHFINFDMMIKELQSCIKTENDL